MEMEFLFNKIKIYQSAEYKFSSDSIRLAKFCEVKKNDTVLELCAGCGVIGFCLLDLFQFKKIYFVDILNSMCTIIDKNIEFNKIENAAVLCKDLKELTQKDLTGKVDVIVFNPPYFKVASKQKVAGTKEIAKTEIAVNFEEIIKCCKRLICFKGSIFFIFPTERLAEAMLILNKYHFEIKKIRFNTAGGKAKTMLVKASYYANSGLSVEF